MCNKNTNLYSIIHGQSIKLFVLSVGAFVAIVTVTRSTTALYFLMSYFKTKEFSTKNPTFTNKFEVYQRLALSVVQQAVHGHSARPSHLGRVGQQRPAFGDASLRGWSLGRGVVNGDFVRGVDDLATHRAAGYLLVQFAQSRFKILQV